MISEHLLKLMGVRLSGGVINITIKEVIYS